MKKLLCLSVLLVLANSAFAAQTLECQVTEIPGSNDVTSPAKVTYTLTDTESADSTISGGPFGHGKRFGRAPVVEANAQKLSGVKIWAEASPDKQVSVEILVDGNSFFIPSGGQMVAELSSGSIDVSCTAKGKL